MKKVLITFSELFYGGAEKQFRELISRIDKESFNIVAVVSGANTGNKDSSAVEKFVEENPQVKFYFLKDISIPKNIFLKLKVSDSYKKQMEKILAEEKPDIVLVYSGIELSGSYLYKKYDAKVIFSERESGNRGKLKFLRYLFFFRKVDKIVCNSLDAKRFYADHNIETSYIPNGIQAHSQMDLPQNDRFHIVVPARIARVKNQELVLKALEMLDSEEYKVTFVGKQEDLEYLSYLKQMVKGEIKKSQIEFLPFTSDVEGIYKNADLIILPSKMEGFTNVLLECYMFGRLCLVSDIVMNRDVANHGQRFFAIDDAQGLSQLIKEVKTMTTSEMKKEIESNYFYVNEKFTLDRMVEAYSKILQNI